MTADLSLGPFIVRRLGRTTEVNGETVSGNRSTGVGTLYELSGPNGLRLTIRDTGWASRERDVVVCERHQSPERFDTLVERLRLAVLDRDGPYVELRQARLRANGRAGLFDADLPTLDEGAGLDVRDELLANGAQAVGTREQLLGDVERTRWRLGARISAGGNALLPVVAYVLTRVAPVATEITA